jgi:hypothetical protein
MNDALLMGLADCGSPEKLLAVILKHHPDWTAPVPVEELASSVNIVEFRELEADGFEGALLTDADKNRGLRGIEWVIFAAEGLRKLCIS